MDLWARRSEIPGVKMDQLWFLYVPEIEPDSFVLFNTRGGNGRSFSIRDYKDGTSRPKYAGEFPDYTDKDILTMASKGGFKFAAPKGISVERVSVWTNRLRELNSKHLPRA